eukprot:3204354-Amphidinium_carterae.2
MHGFPESASVITKQENAFSSAFGHHQVFARCGSSATFLVCDALRNQETGRPQRIKLRAVRIDENGASSTFLWKLAQCSAPCFSREGMERCLSCQAVSASAPIGATAVATFFVELNGGSPSIDNPPICDDEPDLHGCIEVVHVGNVCNALALIGYWRDDWPIDCRWFDVRDRIV